ncbi:MAG: hypothetical protein AAGB46_03515 [Verrucomicrobiota bacterium]
MIRLAAVLLILVGSWASAQEAVTSEQVEVELKDASWFTDELGQAVVYLPATSEPVWSPPYDDASVRFYGVDYIALKDDPRGTIAAVVDFLPRKEGLNTLPKIRFEGEGKVWETRPRQFLVGGVRQSADLEIKVLPEKRRVYQGEPLRLDFEIRTRFQFGRLRDLRLSPSIVNADGVELFVPRSAALEEEQVGIPVASRRVIARERTERDEEGREWLSITFSLFARFEEEGLYEESDLTMRCSRLLDRSVSSNRYAAYFSNGLFERPERGEPYEKYEARGESFSIEVAALPEEGKRADFSGLFSPIAFSVKASPEKMEVGQLVDVEIELKATVASEMLAIPDLSRQKGLRHRFWVGQEVGELWKPRGRIFKARVRPLSESVAYVPSLSFQVFDSDKGAYRELRTKSIPIEVGASDGKGFFDASAIPGGTELAEAAEGGIWHNKKVNTMSGIMNGAVSVLADGFWWIVVLCPITFFVALPWIRKAHRRAMDAGFQTRKRALATLRRELAMGRNPVAAFRAFLANCCDREASAFTASDAEKALLSRGVASEIVDEARALMQSDEASVFGKKEKKENARGEEATRLAVRVFQALGKGLLLLAMSLIICSGGDLRGEEAISDAEELFADALQMEGKSVDSNAVEAAFVEAAIAFEAIADKGKASGIAYYNSGNAWLKAGELGRAIGAYRRSLAFRPFDEEVAENLEAARALCVDAFQEELESPQTPLRWWLAATALVWLATWLVAGLWARFGTRWLRLLVYGCGGASVFLLATLCMNFLDTEEEGVLIAYESVGRKGPGYGYAEVFSGPLHSGLEFAILEERDDWLKARLPNGEICWFQSDSVDRLGLL